MSQQLPWKESEEVEKYLENLGIEYRYSCYGEKNAEGMFLDIYSFFVYISLYIMIYI